MKLFSKILVANRGEIAVRIIRAASSLDIRTVAVFSEADRDALHVEMADESYLIGEKELSDTYLNIDKIINIARCSFCDAMHPGYGFLSENPDFVKACEDSGITFIGPGSKVIALMGNKIHARDFVKSIGVPVIEGLTGTDPARLASEASGMKFPLLVKAASGGGGKGMRIVRDPDGFADAIEATSREAQSYFGDPTVYIEKYLEEPRHIEFQIMGDRHGNVVHLFERECSIQRRYQKILEEAPSPTLTPPLRQKMAEAAVRIGKETGYDNAGTIEFLVDSKLDFYFLEMNTRIQVEHPVTELTTGVDLVREQILVSAGHPLGFRQKELSQQGHAIEVRIYAEDPANQFLPSPGKMTFYHEPQGANIRIDSGIAGKTEIRSFYDPMIAKLIVHESDREQAIAALDLALERYVIHGIRNNISFLRGLIRHQAFPENRLSTRFCDDHLEEILERERSLKEECSLHIPAFAYVIYSLQQRRAAPGEVQAIWNQVGYWRQAMNIPVEIDGEKHIIGLDQVHRNHYEMLFGGNRFPVNLKKVQENRISLEISQRIHRAYISEDTSRRAFVTCQGFTYELKRLDYLPEELFAGNGDELEMAGNAVRAPMNGKVIKIPVEEGAAVKRGQTLMILEAMKMENSLQAPRDAVIEKILVGVGEQVNGNELLIQFAEQ